MNDYCPHGCVNGYIETDSSYGTKCPEHGTGMGTLQSALRGTMEKIFDVADNPQPYVPYSEYLQSPHWQRKRRHVLNRAGYLCEICRKGDRQLDVHHRTYENKGWELSEDLMALCRECHEKTHGINA